jgi:hypothetical protein
LTLAKDSYERGTVSVQLGDSALFDPDKLPALGSECFFIAPIGKEGTPERNRSDGILEFIVGRAADELDLKAVRADKIAEPGQITLQVIEHVLGARAAVADLTGLNPNVFYELAVRHTARLPVALIVEKNAILPFDIAQMRTIFFDHTDLRSADECRREIVAQLRQALESGAVDSPIATTVDVNALASGSVVERNIAELVTTMEEMTRSQRASAAMIEYLLDSEQRGLDPRWLMEVYDSLNVTNRRLKELEQVARLRNDEDLAQMIGAITDTLGSANAEVHRMVRRRGRRPFRPENLQRDSERARETMQTEAATKPTASNSGA